MTDTETPDLADAEAPEAPVRVADLDFDEHPVPAPVSHPERFGRRWRLVGAGLSNVWRFGDLELDAPSGRLLMRGPNGTGKTTALEALWPYLLDLDAGRLPAGRARPTTLRSLMSDGAIGHRRVGYAWLSFAPPGEGDRVVSYGVRLHYAASASPAITVLPFTVPGVPLRDLPLFTADFQAYPSETFTSYVERAGGQVFADDPQAYVRQLAGQVWGTGPGELQLLADRLREVRNPTLLADTSPLGAAAALRSSLPAVDEHVLAATAEALASAAEARELAVRSSWRAGLLTELEDGWTGHVVDIVRRARESTARTGQILQDRQRDVDELTAATDEAEEAAAEMGRRVRALADDADQLRQDVRAAEQLADYRAAVPLADLTETLDAHWAATAAELARLRAEAAHAASATHRTRAELAERVEDLQQLLQASQDAGAEPVVIEQLLRWSDRARRNYLHPGYLVDPGRGLEIRLDDEAFADTAGRWRQRADQRAARAAAAELCRRDRESVALAETASRAADQLAAQADHARDELGTAVATAEETTAAQAARYRDQLHEWGQHHADLRAADADSDVAGWELADLAELATAEPGLIIAVTRDWNVLAVRSAERVAASSGDRDQIESLRRRAAEFPDPTDLVRAEATANAGRTRLANLTAAAQTRRETADAAHRAWSEAHRRWAERAAGFDLELSEIELLQLETSELAAAQALRTAAHRLTDEVLPRLRRLVAEAPDEQVLADRLGNLDLATRRAAQRADRAEALLNGYEADDDQRAAVAAQHELVAREGRTREHLDDSRDQLLTAAARAAELQARLENARDQLYLARAPHLAAQSVQRRLLEQPAIVAALGLGGTDDPGDAAVEAALAGRTAVSRRMLAERYDRARALQAHGWSIQREEPVTGLDDLDVIMVRHGGTTMTVIQARRQAAIEAADAEQRLVEAEQQTRTEFVAGQLPQAIGVAWAELQRWVGDVNAKMRSAAASSGVGVQVEVRLASDLPDEVRRLHTLCCEVPDHERSDAEREEIAAALQFLIGAGGDSPLLDRLRDAVDIRSWVDVAYLVTRPQDERPSRWTSRTGLSGGERRLVVLAPMLAALAAAYDRLGETGLRLVPLDEVPAEVDERGREGLARYIADLDLDLICTSYLWDGSPGAWDGVDAHDLEPGLDGTVVAHPMMIRGLADLPGDEELLAE